MRRIGPGWVSPSESRGEARLIGSLSWGLGQGLHQVRQGVYEGAACHSVTGHQLQPDCSDRAYQDIHVLHQQRVRVIKLVKRDIDLQILLGQCHILIKLPISSSPLSTFKPTSRDS